ncbi:long-chain fatty acid--CoA ligase [Epilithonimonas vandammei]|uniref:Long-chain fatty acid--CoA ligase n=1 Tax=Epilithonimonas vandammei TaxID=2487072 RepID=A0A3G8ZCC4_9FLAO|nr:long-chain fatty acid--CoA ligase [Epilithonimonas vandammei]AZI54888.1 long-chain fatty acid--CoA ligase [Epilithonimonas vandammei]
MEVKRIFDIPYYSKAHFEKDDFVCDKRNGKWEKISTDEYIRITNQLSRALIKYGIKKGDRIALITSTNRVEWCFFDQAALQIGAVTVPIYPSISSEDCVYNLENSGSKICFVSDEKLFDKINTIKSQLPDLKDIFTFDDVKDATNWKELLESGKETDNQQEVETIKDSISEDDLVSIIYTSGTTGKPKGVMLTHKNIVSDVLGCEDRIPHKDSKNKGLSFLPLCHVYERMIIYLFSTNGISIYFAESNEKLSENLKEIKPQYMTVVPRMVEKVYDAIYKRGTEAGGLKSKIFLWSIKVAEKYKIGDSKSLAHIIADKLVFSKWREGLGGNIITLVSGSAALSKRLNTMFHAAGIPILEGYGLTETSPVIAVNSFEHIKIGSVGRPIKNIDVKIQEDGEITVKGPTVTQGYYKDEKQTKEAFTEDGYFKTGDIGILDKDNFLFITDRKKEMFKTSGGKYVAPQVIENLAKASQFIEQIMVVGDGEKMPTALVQPDFEFAKSWASKNNINIGVSPTEIANSNELKAEIEKEISKINVHLGKWEQVKKIELTPVIWTEDNGLLTPTLKLKRKAIKEHFIKLYEKLYDR